MAVADAAGIHGRNKEGDGAAQVMRMLAAGGNTRILRVAWGDGPGSDTPAYVVALGEMFQSLRSTICATNSLVGVIVGQKARQSD